MANGRMTTREAAQYLPMSEATLQRWLREAYLMKAKPCPFGEGVYSEKGEWQYYIFPERLNAYLSARDLTLVSDTSKNANYALQATVPARSI